MRTDFAIISWCAILPQVKPKAICGMIRANRKAPPQMTEWKSIDREIMAKAYGLLWRSGNPDFFAGRARTVLLEHLTKDEQREGIAWVINTFGEMSTSELIAADIRAGVFPSKSTPTP
jgi:hypothetical protein